MRTRRFYRELAIVATPLPWQGSFVVAEHRAILGMRVRPAPLDQCQRVLRFARQIGCRDGAGAIWSLCKSLEENQQHRQQKYPVSQGFVSHRRVSDLFFSCDSAAISLQIRQVKTAAVP